jgi:hypothetical protein
MIQIEYQQQQASLNASDQRKHIMEAGRPWMAMDRLGKRASFLACFTSAHYHSGGGKLHFNAFF